MFSKQSLFIILLLSSFSIVHALSECSESVFRDNINIVNNYDSTVYYDVSIEGNAGIFTELKTPSNFFLQKGELSVLSFETFLPFTGNYNLNIVISDSKGSEKTYYYPFSVENCHHANISVSAGNHYCLNEAGSYSVNVENNGQYDELLNIEVNNDLFSANISKGSSENFDLFFTPKGLNDNKISVKVWNSLINESVNAKLNVTNCDSFNYEINDFKICEGLLKEHFFILENTGAHFDNYTVSTNSEYLKLGVKSAGLNPGEEISVPVNVTTLCDDTGLKVRGITVNSALAGEKIIPVSYEVLNCDSQKVTVYTSSNDYCEEDNAGVIVNVHNTGVKDNAYNTFLKWSYDNKSNYLVLMPDESVNITLNLANISGSDLSLYFKSESINVCNDKALVDDNFAVKNFGECYSGELIVPDFFFNNNTKVTIVNNGSRINEYFVQLSALNEIDNSTIKLNPGDSITFVLNDLMIIHENFNVDEFMVSMAGKGISMAGNVTYYSNNVVGMVVQAGSSAAFILGVSLVLLLSYLFLRKK
ncbi:hypothetical protein COX58_01140 [archaeon CG_4_10_14_0_2_um_filter_Archaea_38_6]|nr:MAG: hypothetical protein COX58_01140 [archaeon CG_4_10_14_0_2_um_filter_Archaea_38_6]